MAVVELATPVTSPSVPTVPSAPPAQPTTGRIRFLGRDGPYWRLMVRGAFLLMVTLGIYRFWLSTDMRRFLWANTEIADESLEYTGTPVELLLGFLIAIATLVPVYTALFLFGLGIMGQWSAVIGFAALTWFGQFAVYRARRYRLTRTVYRGLRFHQTGSATRYATVAIFWWLMIAVTLGLLYPWAQANLERYKMSHTFYGDQRGYFAGSGTRLFARGVLMWLMVMGPLIAGIIIAVRTIDWVAVSQVVAAGGENMMARIETASPDFAKAIVLVVSAGAWSVLAAVLLYPAFQGMTLRWWSSGLRFGDLIATSHLRTGQIYGVYLRFLGYAVAFAILVGIVSTMLWWAFHYMFGSTESSELAELVAIVAAVVGYVAIMLGYSTIYQVTIRLRTWRLASEAVELSGIQVLGHVRAQGAASSPFGEGLADALNVGGL